MNLIQVINGKKHGFLGRDRIYIGRANKSYNLPKSPLYNPYIIGEDGDRATVCKKFDRYLYEKVKRWAETGEVDNEGTIMELLEICLKILELNLKADDEVQPLELTCYCAPLQCHGNGIIRCAYWVIKQEWFMLAYKEYYP